MSEVRAPDAPVRVMIVDDHPMWRDAVARDLPPKIQIVEPIELDERQRDFYDGIRLGQRLPPGGVGADDLDEPAVAGRTAVRRHQAVGRLLLLPDPHQAELDCHDGLLNLFC